MKNFILTFGKKLYNDYFLYSIFKFIMLYFNTIFHLTLIGLNVYFYTIVDIGKFGGLCNIIFSIFLIVYFIVATFVYIEDDIKPFDTDYYEDYFKQIENN